eukprot:1139213-Pelagomonas_calceolata.AAC.4
MNRVDLIAEDVKGAGTGTEDVCPTHIDALAYKGSFNYLSIMFYWILNMATPAERTSHYAHAVHGLRSSDIFEPAVREAESVDPRGNNLKLATKLGLLFLLHATLVKPTYPCLGWNICVRQVLATNLEDFPEVQPVLLHHVGLQVSSQIVSRFTRLTREKGLSQDV